MTGAPDLKIEVPGPLAPAPVDVFAQAQTGDIVGSVLKAGKGALLFDPYPFSGKPVGSVSLYLTAVITDVDLWMPLMKPGLMVSLGFPGGRHFDVSGSFMVVSATHADARGNPVNSATKWTPDVGTGGYVLSQVHLWAVPEKVLFVAGELP